MSDTMKELARPFPDNYIHTNPSGGGSYVKHHVVEQRLIMVLGYPPEFEKKEILYGDVPAIKPNPNGKSQRAKEGRPELKQVIVGVVCRMTAEIKGKERVYEEVGDCEEPHNWTTDGQRLKDAMSDAYKRCAMRLGCGLHLWSQDEFFLFDQLSAGSSLHLQPEPQEAAGPRTSAPAASSPQSQVKGGGADQTTQEQAGESTGSPASNPAQDLFDWAGDDTRRRNQLLAIAAKESLAAQRPAAASFDDIATLDASVLETVRQKVLA